MRAPAHPNEMRQHVRVRLELAEPTVARIARAAGRSALAKFGLENIADIAVQVISELVTNAYLHARDGDAALVLRRDGALLYIEVYDSSPARPALRPARDEDEHGRGLELVADLTVSWGSRTARGGKCVWGAVGIADGNTLALAGKCPCGYCPQEPYLTAGAFA